MHDDDIKKNSLHITFCLRRDANTKPGGDTGKVFKYSENLKMMGYKTKIIYHPRELYNEEKKTNIIHIFNTQTPYENEPYFAWAKKNNVPVVFSSIHHEQYYMELYFKKTLLGKILNYNFYQYFSSLAKEILIYKTLENLKSFLKSPKSISRRIIKESRLVLPLSDHEEQNILKDFSLTKSEINSTIVPNGLTFINKNIDSIKKEIDVLVVGRVEPRKNQLKIAKALSDQKYKVLFIGKGNLNHKKYFDSFIKEVSNSDRLEYIGEINQETLNGYYKKSAVCLSNSWFEVVSQVDLEAVSLGCKPIVSSASAIFDYFQSPPIHLKPDCSIEDIVKIIDSAYSENYRPSLKKGYSLSWTEISESLSYGYISVIKDHAR